MAEPIIDGTGSGFRAAVDVSNRLLVRTEGITVGSLSVSAGSETWVQNTVEVSGAVDIDNLYAGSSVWQGEVWGVSGIVVGSITSMPSISVTTGSESWIQNTVEVSGSVDIDNRVAGSIVNMPITPVSGTVFSDIAGSVAITSPISVTTGSESWIQNVVEVSGAIFTDGDITGSFAISTAIVPVSGTITANIVDPVAVGSYTTQEVLGSVAISSPISVTVGSESWIQNFEDLGSTVVIDDPVSVGSYTTQEILGSVAISSPINVTTGSESWIQNTVEVSGAKLSDLVGSFAVTNFTAIGSNVVVTNFDDLGSNVLVQNTVAVSGTAFQEILGSVAISSPINVTTGSESWIQNVVEVSGAIFTGGDITGSVVVSSMPGVVGVSGTLFQDIAGSVAITSPISVTTGSESWIQNTVEVSGAKLDDIAGSVAITNFNAIGSDVVVTNFNDLGSTVVIDLPVEVSGAIFTGGDITGSFVIINDPVPVSGVFNVQTGSETWEQNKVEVEQTRGIFNSSGTTFIGSFTGSRLITPGAGSNLFLKGFTASAELATKFGIAFSGGTAIDVGNWSIPNSGTVAMNMIGMEPSGAVNQPLMVKMFNAGSLHFTAFTKDSL